MSTFIYQNSLREFNADLFNTVLTQKLDNALKKAHIGVSLSQDSTFEESLLKLGFIFGPSYLCQDIQCCIEYRIRASGGYRIDFMLSGYDENDNKNVVVIELKRWSSDNVSLIPESNNVKALVSREAGFRETMHPSFQSFNYCDLLNLFYKEVNEKRINVFPCSYLHNYEEKNPPVLNDKRFNKILELSPMFLKADNEKLLNFIKRYIKKPDNKEIFEILNNSEICPTTDLQKNVKKIFLDSGNFKLFGNQNIAFNAILSAIKNAIVTGEKKVFIIQGGPGTGKSIVALKLMATIIHDMKRLAFYVTQTSAPRGTLEREVHKSVDPNDPRGHATSELIEYAGNWVTKERKPNELDCVIVDESHRLKTSTQGAIIKNTSIIKEIIKSSKVSVFFVDDNQTVAYTDVGTIENITNSCLEITGEKPVMKEEYNLVSQFRCNGSSGYIAFIEHVLYGTPYPDEELTFDYEPVFCNESPLEMVLAIKEKQQKGFKARYLAGYCYDYKNNVGFVTPLGKPWNFDVKRWASDPNANDQVGCVYSSQGMEFDYTGVVIGNDMRYENGKVVFDCEKHSTDDHTYMNKDFRRTVDNIKKANRYIRNAYNVLLTRGMKGCYIYCENKELGKYLENEWKCLKEKYIK